MGGPCVFVSDHDIGCMEIAVARATIVKTADRTADLFRALSEPVRRRGVSKVGFEVDGVLLESGSHGDAPESASAGRGGEYRDGHRCPALSQLAKHFEFAQRPVGAPDEVSPEPGEGPAVPLGTEDEFLRMAREGNDSVDRPAPRGRCLPPRSLGGVEVAQRSGRGGIFGSAVTDTAAFHRKRRKVRASGYEKTVSSLGGAVRRDAVVPHGEVSYRGCLPAARAIISSAHHSTLQSLRPDRILVIRLGALGDVLRTLPAVAGLRGRFPEAHITWLVESSASGALAAEAMIDEVRIFPREAWTEALRGGHWGHLIREAVSLRKGLYAGRFDLVLDFHGILKSGILARTTGSAVRVGFARPTAREGSWVFSTHRVSLPGHPVSRFERNLALVEPFVAGAPQASSFRLTLDSHAVQQIDEHLGDGPAPVAFHPGTSRSTPFKRLPISTYAALASRLRRDHGLPVIVTGGPGEEEQALAKAVVAASGAAASLGPRTVSFGDLAALLARCRLLVSGDSGPLHAASLVGTPVVQLLGPTHPVENAPFSATPSRSLRAGLPCSPCRRGCAAASCMSALGVASIQEACESLLGLPRKSEASGG